MDLAHVAIWVSDLERALSFYDAIGLERTHDFELDGVQNVYVGGDRGELQLRYDPDRTTPIAPSRADTDHVAFTVDDRTVLEDTFEAAINAGGTAVAEPHEVAPADAYAAFLEDPEGYTLELVAPL